MAQDRLLPGPPYAILTRTVVDQTCQVSENLAGLVPPTPFRRLYPLMRKWILTAAFVLLLAALGWTAQGWFPPFLAFVDVNSDRIQGITDLAQLIFWGLALIALVAGFWGINLRGLLTGQAPKDTPAVAPAVAPAVQPPLTPPTQHTETDTGGGAAVGGNVAMSGGTFTGRDSISHFYTVYQAAPGQPQMGERDVDAFAQAVQRYLGWVEKRYGQLNMRGIERRERQVLSLTIEDVYVSLQAAVQPERKAPPRRNRATPAEEEMRAEMLAQEERFQTVDMAQLLGLGKRLAIIGGPGSGKTTFLHIIAASLARALGRGDSGPVARSLGLTGDLPLPIFVSLSDYNRYRKDNARSADPRQGTLTAFISYSLIRQEAALGLPDDFFTRLLHQGQSCILLLDGLDEVADERERAQVRQQVERLAANGGIAYLLVTSRSRAYRESAVLAEEFRVAEVQPMNAEQVQALAERWCRAAYDETRAEAEVAALAGAIAALEAQRKQRGEPRLIDSPLLVTIVAIVHYNQRRLPDERAKLYERCVEVLLAESYKPESDAIFDLVDRGGDEDEKRNLLAWLAFCLMAAGEASGRSVDESQLRAWLRPHLARRVPQEQVEHRLDDFVAAMRERGSLLDERDGVYRFIHLTFQEFLCAYYLVESVREVEKIVDILCQAGRVAESWWRETILLAVGYLGLRSPEQSLALVQALVQRAADQPFALAAAEVATAAFLEQNGADPASRGLLTERLVAHLTDPADGNAPVLRAAAGRGLSRLGDPRKGVGVVRARFPVRARYIVPVQGIVPVQLPDIDWVQIPEVDENGRREFIYQTNERRIEPTFWMARYPITYAQFQTFIDAPDGWSNPDWWKGLARNDQNNQGEQAFPFPNHPRERVSWYQAIAFCRWLTAQAEKWPELLPVEVEEKEGWRVTLPTEWQWEKAARGHDGREYPWGTGYRSGFANVDETQRKAGPFYLETSSAVGIYPQGASPYGLLDLSGNVWEWCLNEYEIPGNVQEIGSKGRVLRGGSWNLNPISAAAVRRYWGHPNFRNFDFGFRVVWSASVPATSGL